MKEPEVFPAFWDLWRPHARKTDGRKLARETFAKHVRAGADPEDIVYGAAWFLRTMKERDREFIPLSSTWMNRGSYEDDCILERKRIDAMRQAERTPANNDERAHPKPDYEARAAQVERMKAKMRGAA